MAFINKHHHPEMDFTLEGRGKETEGTKHNSSEKFCPESSRVNASIKQIGPRLHPLPLILNAVVLRAASRVPRASLKWLQTLLPPSFI